LPFHGILQDVSDHLFFIKTHGKIIGIGNDHPVGIGSSGIIFVLEFLPVESELFCQPVKHHERRIAGDKGHGFRRGFGPSQTVKKLPFTQLLASDIDPAVQKPENKAVEAVDIMPLFRKVCYNRFNRSLGNIDNFFCFYRTIQIEKKNNRYG